MARSDLAWLPALCLALGCSFTQFDSAECRTTRECQRAFGIGSICQADGLCAEQAAEPRCTGSPPELFADPGDRFIVGTLGDFSLATHVGRANAVQLAIEDANESGGYDGREFALVRCDIREDASIDGRSRAEAAIAMAQYLEDVVEVPVIVGPPGSDEAMTTFAATSDVVLLTPSATSPLLTALEPDATDAAPGRLWRTAPPDAEQALQIGMDIRTRDPSDVMLVAQAGAYGDGLTDLLQPELPDLMVVSFATEGQLTSALGMAASAEVGEVIIASSSTDDYIDFLRAALSEPGLASTRFFLTDAAANQDFVAGVPGDAGLRARIRGTRPAKDLVLADEFERRYRIAFGSEPPVERLSFAAHAFDAGWLSLYGIVWASSQEGEVTPVGVGRGLRQLSDGADFNVGDLTWSAVVDELAAGQSVDIRGASGALDYDPVTEERSEDGQSFELWQLSDDGANICRVGDTDCI